MTTIDTEAEVVLFPGVDPADAPRPHQPAAIEDFTSHPVTVGELRSEESNSAKDWTVRDMLIFMLRDIDSGGDFAHATRAVLIVAKVDDDGNTRAENFVAGTKNSFETMGLVSNCLLSLQDRLA